MKAVGYFRTTASGPKHETLAAQNKEFLEYCEQHGYEAQVTFVETSNGNGHRGSFRQLVDYLRQPEKGFVVVVVRSIEGLGADLKESVRRYFQLEGLGAQVAFLSGTEDPLEEIVELWAARSGGDLLGERVRSAMRRKAVKGEVLGRPPYGYHVGNRRRLELVPEEAVVVRYIFRLYLHEGLGIRLIARRLNEEGNRTRRGGNWSMVSIRDILRNRVYLGTYSRFGVRVPGSHPALVSPDDFRAVQDRMTARRNNYATRRTTPFLLAGLVQCGDCGNKMIGVSRRQSWRRRSGGEGKASYRYYQCESRTNQSMCDYHTQRAEELEEQVRGSLRGVDAEAIRLAAGDETGVRETWEAEAKKRRTKVRQFDRHFDEFLASAAKGRITREQLHTLSVANASERLKYEDALEEVERKLRDQLSAVERSKARERSLSQLLDGWETLAIAERQELLREHIDRVVVRDEGIEVTLRP